MQRALVLVVACSGSGSSHHQGGPDRAPWPAPADAQLVAADAQPVAADAVAEEPAPPAKPPAPPPAAKDPKSIRGYAHVRAQQGTANGSLRSLTPAKPLHQRVAWTLVVGDAKGDKTFTIELPENVPLQLAVGSTVDVQARVNGGGPNAIGTMVIADDKGVAVAVNFTPAGWAVDYGKRLNVDKGTPYDSASYAVLIKPSKGKPVELVSSWSAVELEGVKYVAQGSAVKRTLHKGKPAPPDYVGSWIDFAVIRR